MISENIQLWQDRQDRTSHNYFSVALFTRKHALLELLCLSLQEMIGDTNTYEYLVLRVCWHLSSLLGQHAETDNIWQCKQSLISYTGSKSPDWSADPCSPIRAFIAMLPESLDIVEIIDRNIMIRLHIFFIVLGFNNTSTLVGHFVSTPREREKRDRRDSRGDEIEGQGRKRNRNESEETEEIKTFPLYPYLLQG